MSGKARLRLVINPTTSMTARHMGISTVAGPRDGDREGVVAIGTLPTL
jgi:hypothetical protein